MSDVRRLNLAASPLTKVEATDISEFTLSSEKLAIFEMALGEIEGMSFWSPVFQAWYPLVDHYLWSGANVRLAEKWSKRIADKKRVFGPRPGTHTKVFAELLRSYRVREGEAFADFAWAEIQSLLDWTAMVLDNEKTIFSTLLGGGFIRNELDDLLQYNQVDGLSECFHEAVYLYRHCPLDDPSEMVAIKKEIDAQARIYVQKFSAAFEAAASVCDSSRDVFAWYRTNVKYLISNAWLDCTNLSGKRYAITKADVIDLPIWLSENLTDYVGELPCVCDLDVDNLYVFNSLQAILSPDASVDDGNSFFAYTLARTVIRKLFNTLNTFYWDVRQGQFFHDLYLRMETVYEKDQTGTAQTPKEYIHSLVERGFPVKG